MFLVLFQDTKNTDDSVVEECRKRPDNPAPTPVVGDKAITKIYECNNYIVSLRIWLILGIDRFLFIFGDFLAI